MSTFADKISNYADDVGHCLGCLAQDPAVDRFLHRIVSAQRIFVAGNGGSAAVAGHFVVDYNKCSLIETNNYAICLSDNVPLLTAQANDHAGGWETAYTEAMRTYKPTERDLLVLISSSGESKNVLHLAKEALKFQMKVVSLTGWGHNSLDTFVKQHYGVALCVTTANYGVIEDTHMGFLHALCQHIRNAR